MASSNLPRKWWGEAVHCANYMRNRTPHSAHLKTPFEMWTGRKPDGRHLHVFGSKVTVMILERKRKKLDNRSQEGIFVGYPDNTAGYRIKLPSDQIIESSDVAFFEESVLQREFRHFHPIEDFLGDNLPSEHINLDDDSDDEQSQPQSTPHISPLPDSMALPPEPPKPPLPELPDSPLSPGELPSSLVTAPLPPLLPTPTTVTVAAQDKPTIAPLPKPIARPPAFWKRPERQIRPPTRLTYDKLGSPTSSHFSAYASKLLDLPSPLCYAVSQNEARTPRTVEDALAGPERIKWKKAIEEELQSIEHHDTYTWAPLPDGVEAVKSGIVLKIKPPADGRPERFKARVVAKGYSQIEGIDFQINEIYAPVIGKKTLRFTCAFAAQNDMHLHKMDVKTAFLNGELPEYVYMEPPPGVIPPPGMDGYKWRLEKSLYGLKQSPRLWNEKLHEYLTSLGFTRLESDYGIYFVGDGDSLMLITVYVDDILIACKDLEAINAIKRDFSERFEMTDYGEATSILGISIIRDWAKGTIILEQRAYIDEIVTKFNQDESNGKVTPMETNIEYSKNMCPATADEMHRMANVPYRQAVGSLMHLMVCTRPDLAYPVSVLSRYMQNPGLKHWEGVKRIIQYIKRTRDLGLRYRKTDSPTCGRLGTLDGYCDSNWARDRDDMCSTGGWIFLMNGGAISWQSKKAKSPAQSSCDAEYIADGMAALEVSWMRSLFGEIGLEPSDPIPVHTDSTSALRLAENPLFHERSKHIALKWHFTRYMLHYKQMSLHYIGTKDQVADCLTKPLSEKDLAKALTAMGLINLSVESPSQQGRVTNGAAMMITATGC